MAETLKVECLSCSRKYYIDENEAPEDAEANEAFPHNCPYCEERQYALLVKD